LNPDKPALAGFLFAAAVEIDGIRTIAEILQALDP
jgi:hypothetical protein